MSNFATAWAWDQKITKNEKLLLLFLADSADRSGKGAGLADLLDNAVAVCGFDQQTMRKHLDSLRQTGLVRETDDGGYQLNLGSHKPQLGAFRLEGL
jgi:hypothetical protein